MAQLLFWPSKYNFYPIGNTSAVSLTGDLPPEEPANLLLLGCGDPRNVLFTIYTEPEIGGSVVALLLSVNSYFYQLRVRWTSHAATSTQPSWVCIPGIRNRSGAKKQYSEKRSSLYHDSRRQAFRSHVEYVLPLSHRQEDKIGAHRTMQQANRAERDRGQLEGLRVWSKAQDVHKVHPLRAPKALEALRRHERSA
jgi:Domain of unknown function (DUF4470)